MHHERVATIRIATADEADTLAKLQRCSAMEAYRDIFPPEAPQPSLVRLRSLWRSWLDPDSGAGLTGFVADAAGEPVGVVLAGSDPLDASLGNLARMYVSPDHWGQGLGRSLYVAATRHLRAAGHVEASLWVLEGNQRARSWYERLGWVATGERKSVHRPASIDQLRYRRVLPH